VLGSASHASDKAPRPDDSDRRSGPKADSLGQNNAVTTATVIAFVVFLVIDSLAGDTPAAITFLVVFVGLVFVLPLVSLAIRSARRARLDEIQLAATLAADMAVRRMSEERQSHDV